MIRRKVLGIFILFAISSSSLAANSELDTLGSSERVKIISQSLAKNYLYIHQNLQVSSAKLALKDNILSLSASISNIQSNAKNQEIKELAEFMFFSSDELQETLKESFTIENGGLVLDYTESLLEGSGLIIQQSSTKKNNEQLIMLKTVKEMEYLLERAAKYYIAFRAGYKDSVNVEQATNSVNKFEALLSKVKKHKYSVELASGPVKKLSKYWPVSKNFFLGIKQSKLPSIVFISTKHMSAALGKLSKHHNEAIKSALKKNTK